MDGEETTENVELTHVESSACVLAFHISHMLRFVLQRDRHQSARVVRVRIRMCARCQMSNAVTRVSHI